MSSVSLTLALGSEAAFQELSVFTDSNFSLWFSLTHLKKLSLKLLLSRWIQGFTWLSSIVSFQAAPDGPVYLWFIDLLSSFVLFVFEVWYFRTVQVMDELAVIFYPGPPQHYSSKCQPSLLLVPSSSNIFFTGIQDTELS